MIAPLAAALLLFLPASADAQDAIDRLRAYLRRRRVKQENIDKYIHRLLSYGWARR